MSKYEEAIEQLEEKLGNKDGLISLSTIALSAGANGKSRPAARIVNACYEDGAFYIVTWATAGKMLQIAQNPEVAVCVIVENFTADGVAEDLGWVGDEKNAVTMAKLRKIFAAWYSVANEGPHICLLRIRLTKGLWNDPHKGLRNEIDFVNKTAN